MSERVKFVVAMLEANETFGELCETLRSWEGGYADGSDQQSLEVEQARMDWGT